jgi:hypothetical protein
VSGKKRRLRRIEGKARSGEACPGCGYRPDEEPEVGGYVVEWQVIPPPPGWTPPPEALANREAPPELPEPKPEPEPELPPPCPACGREFVTTVEWVDAPGSIQNDQREEEL